MTSQPSAVDHLLVCGRAHTLLRLEHAGKIGDVRNADSGGDAGDGTRADVEKTDGLVNPAAVYVLGEGDTHLAPKGGSEVALIESEVFRGGLQSQSGIVQVGDEIGHDLLDDGRAALCLAGPHQTAVFSENVPADCAELLQIDGVFDAIGQFSRGIIEVDRVDASALCTLSGQDVQDHHIVFLTAQRGGASAIQAWKKVRQGHQSESYNIEQSEEETHVISCIDSIENGQ